ncbi:hypothetical protein GF324_11325, partial [bacterium]|nr:hypothetical protein [bacterium]
MADDNQHADDLLKELDAARARVRNLEERLGLPSSDTSAFWTSVVQAEKYRAIARNLPRSVILLYDSHLRILLAEGPEIEAIGYTREDFEGKLLSEITPPEIQPDLQDARHAAERGDPFATEFSYRGHLYLLQASPIFDVADN